MRFHTGLAASLVACHLLVACSGAGRARPEPFPRTGPADPANVPGASALAAAIVRTALDLRGTPYAFGGSDPRGFDCSGFVQFVYGRHGQRTPREVTDLYRSSVAVPLRRVAPGDLLFFSTKRRGASHVAISLGDRRFVHAPSSGGVVRVEDLDVNYWSRRFLGARRLALD